MPDAAIVIPTVGRWSRLALLLKALLPQLGAAHEIVIVVDADVTMPEALRAAPVRIVKQGPPHGRAHARNAGIRAANAATVLLLDEDMLVGPGWLAAHAATQARGGGLVRGEIRELPALAAFADLGNWDGRDASNALRKRGERMIAAALSDFDGCWTRFGVESGLQKLANAAAGETALGWIGFAGANLSAPRRLLLERPFDERAGTNWGLEDLTLALGILRAGGGLSTAPGARALHMTHAQADWKDRQRANAALLDVLAPPLRAPALELIEHASAPPQLDAWRAAVARQGGLFDA